MSQEIKDLQSYPDLDRRGRFTQRITQPREWGGGRFA